MCRAEKLLKSLVSLTMEFTEQDIKFLENLRFKSEIPDDPDEDPEELKKWISYNLYVNDHQFIDGLWICIDVIPNTISVFNNRGEAVIEKPFSQIMLLALMDFLRLPVHAEYRPEATD